MKMGKLQYYSAAEQSARQNGAFFAKAPLPIVFSGKKISPNGKNLYYILCHYGRNGKINVSVERLAADMEVSTRQVRNLLGELEDKNLIRRLPVFNSPNNILLLSLQPKEITPGDDRHQQPPDEPTSRRPEQRRRPPATASAATPTEPAGRADQPPTRAATATASDSQCSNAHRASRTSRPAADQSSDSDRQRQPMQGARGEKYFRAGASEETNCQDEPAEEPEIFFQKGVKYISAKREESKEINSTVCEAQSSDVSLNQLDKGKEGAGDYHRTKQRYHKPEQKTGENTENQPDNLGYVALRNFGIWEGKARRLAEIAARQHGDEADRYITNWIEETNRRKRVQDPCAYLSSAISDNWKLPAARRANQSERRANNQPNATGSRNNRRPSGAQKQRQLKPIDFSKYANVAPTADERRDQDADRSAAPGATVTIAPPVYRETDFYLRLALNDYRPQIAYLLDYAELSGDGVKVRFMGGRQPLDFEPGEWLRFVQAYYPNVTGIEIARTH